MDQYPPSPEMLLDALDEEQREVAANPLGAMAVLAGAGTGKTRALTHRIAYGVHTGQMPARRVLAVTFTARAAGELRGRLQRLGVPAVTARTFHATALRQLTFFWPQIIGGSAAELLGSKQPLLREAALTVGSGNDKETLAAFAAEIAWAKSSLLTPAMYEDAAIKEERQVTECSPGEVGKVFDTYEELKTGRGRIDFEDVLLLTLGMLHQQERIAQQVRSAYQYLVVDEFQDVTPLQYRLLQAWLGDNENICVVGDADQTIYSFAGASAKYLLNFAQDFPDSKTVRLQRNYRCTPEIVALGNGVLAKSKSTALQAQNPSGSDPVITAYADENAQAAGVAAAIAKLLQQGAPAREIAVLGRTNSQLGEIADFLREQEVPYVVHTGKRYFSRPEVREALVVLRAAANNAGKQPVREIVREVLIGRGWSEKPPVADAARSRWESLDALVGLADSFLLAEETESAGSAKLKDAQRSASGRHAGNSNAEPLAEPENLNPLQQFLVMLRERESQEYAPIPQAISLATLHAAKGLEWDAVFLVGMSEGLMPYLRSTTSAQKQEERRLLYVGITRARRELHLSYARKTFGRKRRISPFLAGQAARLGTDTVPSRGSAAPARRGHHKAVCGNCGQVLHTAAERRLRRCQQCPPTYDSALLQSLQEWRASAAAAVGVPEFVVCTDSTLQAIAQLQPADVPALQTIPGLPGPKLSAYGPSIVQVVQNHLHS